MTEMRTHRRLAAVLAADVAGYSRMMGADEAGTLAALREVWTARFNPTVAAHRGRIVKMMGDGALVEFASAVDAVECAVSIQTAMAAFNAERPGQEPMVFRIGVNLGDIVIEGDDILGDGVNVAARLEPLAPRGGILVSDAVHAQVRGKVEVAFADAGELDLKNIARPVRAWIWGGDGALSDVTALHDEVPSVAILPFNNMSGDPEQEYFSDGISEDIITDLSKIAGLMVVARNSSFAYKGRNVDIRVVGRELGVTSVLEGSIRRAGNRVRITAQLIDARTGGHLWADRYDRDLTDIFAVQDEVTMKIVEALKVTLQPSERAMVTGGGTFSVEAHDCVLRAREHWLEMLASSSNKASAAVDKVLSLLQRAIDLDPQYAEAYAYMSMVYSVDLVNRWTGTADPQAVAMRYSALALQKDPNEPIAYIASAIVKIYVKDLPGAKADAERAIALNPSSATGYGTLGHIMVYLGNPLSAVPYLERAMRLDPHFAQQYKHFLGTAYLVAGDYKKAELAFRKRIELAPRTDLSRAFLASTLGHLGDRDGARQIWDELKALNPDYSFARHIERLPMAQVDAQRIADGLRAAGLDLS